jgi:hypothetical protein
MQHLQQSYTVQMNLKAERISLAKAGKIEADVL